MSLLNAHQSLLGAARARGRELEPESCVPALIDLLEVAEERDFLPAAHPWELAPAVCRELEDRLGYAPPGGWSRLVGLSAGAGVFHAAAEGFFPLATPAWVEAEAASFPTRLVEAFTSRLIPPAAAAALYVALDVHPLWGLELGRDVGAMQAPVSAPARMALPVVRRLVFGTITGLLVAMRTLDPDALYPVDALGDLLWWAAVRARGLARVSETPLEGLPIFLDGSAHERRLLTTRLAVADLLDFVFVPAGVVRRDDAGRFAAQPAPLVRARAGGLDLDDQIRWWAQALELDLCAAC